MFIEHFAIRKDQRSKGYGSLVVSGLISAGNLPIILEVEPPGTPEADRRINFYQKHRFELLSAEYYQPPYAIGKNPVEMRLMKYPDKLCSVDFDHIKRCIYTEVYLIEE